MRDRSAPSIAARGFQCQSLTHSRQTNPDCPCRLRYLRRPSVTVTPWGSRSMTKVCNPYDADAFQRRPLQLDSIRVTLRWLRTAVIRGFTALMDPSTQ